MLNLRKNLIFIFLLSVTQGINYDDIIYQGIQLPSGSTDEEIKNEESFLYNFEEKAMSLLVFSGWTDWSACPESKSLLASCITRDEFEKKSYLINLQKRERICRQADVILSRSSVEPCQQDEMIQQETRECQAPSICPPPINGAWSNWSEWSECSLKCQQPDDTYDRRTERKISTGWQTRQRHCNNPTPKYGGNKCDGLYKERQLCTNSTTPYCPIHGSWTPWQPLRACDPLVNIDEELPENYEWRESFNIIEPGRRCTPGVLLQERRCSAPQPRNGGSMCLLSNSSSNSASYGMVELQRSHCWIQEGCISSQYSQMGLDPAQDCSFRSVGSNRVEIYWRRQSYGRIPTYYLIRWHNGRSNEFDQRIVIVNDKNLDAWGESYHEIVDNLRSQENYEFEIFSILEEDKTNNLPRLEAKDPACQAEVYTGRVDGKWSSWSAWDECSSTCIRRRGVQNRYRTCVFHDPYNKGSDCSGDSEIEKICYGQEFDC